MPKAKARLRSTVASPIASVAQGNLPSQVLAATVAAAALAAAIQNGNGMLHGAAIEWLTVAVLAAAMGLVLPRAAWLQRACAWAVPWALLAGMLYAFYMWPFVRPALYVQPQTPTSQTVYMVALAAAAVVSGLSLSPPPWLKRAHLGVLLTVYAALGLWLLHSSPEPRVDVVTLHNEALSALVRGQNPFAITFPNIFADISHYPEGMVRDGRVLFGYDYPPLNLLMALPFYLLGDYRLGLLVANALSAALLVQLAGRLPTPRAARAPQFGLALAALFLFTPRALLILENGWTEPFTVLLLVGTLWACVMRPQAVPVFLGLLVASKQYVVLLLASAYHLPVWADMPGGVRAKRAFWGQAVACAAAVTLPFFLWSPAAFWHSVVSVPIQHPFREDALNFLAWYRQTQGVLLPTALGFIAAALASAAAVWRLPRTTSGFAYALGTIFLFFIAFNRQAFCNYYFLTIAAFYAAAATGQDALAEPAV
jgi:hypothetical protein